MLPLQPESEECHDKFEVGFSPRCTELPTITAKAALIVATLLANLEL